MKIKDSLDSDLINNRVLLCGIVTKWYIKRFFVDIWWNVYKDQFITFHNLV